MHSFMAASVIFLSLSVQASFDTTSLRYVMPDDIANKLVMLFPNSTIGLAYNSNDGILYYSSVTDRCLIDRGSGIIPFSEMGSISPATGDAQAISPNASTAQKIFSCIELAATEEFKLVRTETDLRAMFPHVTLSELQELQRDTLQRFFPIFKSEWEEGLTNDSKFYNRALRIVSDTPEVRAHTRYLVNYMLGPDKVIAEYGQAQSADEIASMFVSSLAKRSMNFLDYTIWVLKNLSVREEFISF